MNGKLAAGIAQAIDRQQLQHFFPRDRASLIGELALPENIQVQLPPQQTAQPAVAKGTRPKQLYLIQPYRHRLGHIHRYGAIIGKQAELARLSACFIEHGSRLPPRLLLAVVDLAQVEHLPLCRGTAVEAA